MVKQLVPPYRGNVVERHTSKVRLERQVEPPETCRTGRIVSLRSALRLSALKLHLKLGMAHIPLVGQI